MAECAEIKAIEHFSCVDRDEPRGKRRMKVMTGRCYFDLTDLHSGKRNNTLAAGTFNLQFPSRKYISPGLSHRGSILSWDFFTTLLLRWHSHQSTSA